MGLYKNLREFKVAEFYFGYNSLSFNVAHRNAKITDRLYVNRNAASGGRFKIFIWGGDQFLPSSSYTQKKQPNVLNLQ